jgi:hypothetical protein
MGKNNKKIKIWVITHEDSSGYWVEDKPDFSYEFLAMSGGEKFTIECRKLAKKEYNSLVKSSGEFGGW